MDLAFGEAVMSESKSIAFDEDDFPIAPQPRKGPSALPWAIGLGILVFSIVVFFLIYAFRRATEVRFAEMARVEAEESAAEARTVRDHGIRVKALREEPRGPTEDVLRRSLPERLKAARLEPIIRDAKWFWSFSSERFILDAGKELLPSDLQIALLGADLNASRIEGKWNLVDDIRKLVLSDIQVDGKGKSDGEVILAIEPAGPVRVNLGSYQYNIIPVRQVKK